MATKKKARNIVSEAHPVIPETTVETDIISTEDRMKFRIVMMDVENVALRQELAKLQYEKHGQELAAAKTQLSKINQQVNEKYGLNAGTDKFDLTTGQISRGAQE